MTCSGFKLVGAAALVAMGVAAPAGASTIYTSNADVNHGTFQLMDISVVSGGVTTTETSTPVGQFNLTSSYSPSGLNSFNIQAWCIDFTHSIDIPGPGPFTFTGSPLAGGVNNVPAMTPTQLNQISWLAKLGNETLATNYSDILSAEYQYAIWSVEYGAANISISAMYNWNGSAAVNQSSQITSFTSAVSALLASIPNTAVPGGGVQLVSGGSGGANQTLLVFVPEPASMAVLAVGMLGMGIARRRKRAAA